MLNHFHFLLQQIQDNGISIFLANLQNSYARYFNTKYDRGGSLFREMFKAVRIESEEQLIHVTRYIHLNHVTAYLIKLEELEYYPYTSFPVYMGNVPYEFVSTDLILNHFKTPERYKEFVFNQADYQRKLRNIKHLLLDE